MKTITYTALLIALPFLALEVDAQSFLTNGLVAYYPLNGNAIDASGNGHNGVVNGATAISDRYGSANSALAFTPTNNISTSFLPPLGTASRTVSFWFNVPNNSQQMAFLSYGGDGSSWGDRFLMVAMETGELGFDVAGAGVTTATTWKDSKWHQFIVVMPTNALLTDASIFVDGKKQKNLSYYNNANLNTSSTFPLTFGQLYLNGDHRYLTGSMDDVRIYNRNFTTNEVAQLYAIEAPAFLNIKKAVYLDSATLKIGTNYQLQVSGDLNTWTNYGAAFIATNFVWSTTNYWNVDEWNQLFFRLKTLP